MNSNLSIYLNDHLAGSVAGLEILERLTELLAGSPFVSEIDSVRAEVAEDKEVLETIIERLNFKESTIRKASGWLAEKAAQLKMLVDDPGSGPFRTFESLEAISLGIEGKRSLWIALATVAGDNGPIRVSELEDLITRAEDQRRRVESVRLKMALEAFGSPDA